MNEELFKKELWNSLCETATDLYYIDSFRDYKQRIDPLYKGLLSCVAIIASIISFFDSVIAVKVVSTVTAILATAPFLFPILPQSSDFEKIDKLRVAIDTHLQYLSKLWLLDWKDETFEEYSQVKIEYAVIDNEVSSLFGKINTKLEKKAQDKAYRYLDKFFVT